MANGYTADEILQNTIAEISLGAKLVVNFPEKIDLVFTRDLDERESSSLTDSACIIEKNGSRFLVFYSRIIGADYLRGFIKSKLAVASFDTDPYMLEVEKSYFLRQEPSEETLEEYLARKFGGDQNDPKIRAGLIIKQGGSTLQDMVYATDESTIRYPKKNYVMRNLLRNDRLRDCVIQSPEYSQEVFLPCIYGAAAFPTKTGVFNERLSSLLVEIILENIDILSRIPS